MIKPKVLVIYGYGINCEEETKYAFEAAGADAKLAHLNDLIAEPQKIRDFQIMAFSGGFAYGDDTGAGNAFAHKMKNHLWDEVLKFIEGDRLVFGACNGFQILVNMGLLPGLSRGAREVALVANDSARYSARWIDLKVTNDSPWLKNIDTFFCPIAHGEGKFFAPPKVLTQLKKNKQIALTYFKGPMCEYQSLEANPNGSVDDIAAITDPTGRILGLMPHAERATFFTQRPDWTKLKEEYTRQGKKLPTEGPGLKIFQNAIKYFH